MNKIQQQNQNYWNNNAKDWFGCTALPNYGVRFAKENDLNLFDPIQGKVILDIGCGSGHSLKYCGDRQAEELWGLDISDEQLALATEHLTSHAYEARLVQSTMETCLQLPRNYFDIIYSIYAIGWTTDLKSTFQHVYEMLKPGGSFIFSWQHPLHHCVRKENDCLVVKHSYHNESYYDLNMDGMTVKLSSRKLSTFINALIETGLVIEHVSESSDPTLFSQAETLDQKSRKATMVPLSFVIKARKQ